MQIRRWWGIVLALVAALGLLVSYGQTGRVALAETKAPSWQIQMDGRRISGFQEVSGLGMEYQPLEAVCRDGRDDDCDGVSTEIWQAGVYKALWEVAAAADEMERNTALAGRARHDIALNAIRNLKALVRLTEEQMNQAASVQSRHDTSKNAIGNIRAVARVLNDIAGNEPGFPKESSQRLSSALNSLQGLTAEWTVRKYRPGRPVFGNITLRAGTGSMDPALVEWFNTGARKSGSIIYLDREGNEVLRYNFYEAWPVKWEVGQIVEEIEFVVERVERAK